MTTESPTDPQEVQLEALIHSRIRQMGTDIHVLVKDGLVTLTGSADDYKTKREIDVLVRGIGGVRDLVNKLVVASITIFIVIFINAITRRKFIGILQGIGISGEAIEIDASYVEGHVGDLADNADLSRFIL